MARTAKSSIDQSSWRHIKLAPATLLYGPNEYFVQRASHNLKELFNNLHEESEVITINAKDYRAGELTMHTSPSLFNTAKVIQATGLASMSEPFLNDVMAYLKEPQNDILLILHHHGGNRGKKLLDIFRSSRTFNYIECKELKRDNEKLEFVQWEIRERGKKIDPRAAQVLINAAGSDTAELASAAEQLVKDGPEVITVEIVDKYYGGRTEATAFKVSDAAVNGNSREALRLFRHALETGVEPIPLVGALAARMRNIARVHKTSGSASSLASNLKLAPWQVEQAQRDSRRYSEDDLASILRALAEADAQLKGEATNPGYAVEKAILAIAAPAGRR